MPAVTVADITVLPRIKAVTGTRARTVRSITTAPQGFEGEGFPVRRAFAGVDIAQLDPFIHLDQMGEVEYAPGEPKGTPWHPHRGFETVTYIIDGIFDHFDNNGGGGTISDGDTQWMTAGAGILHIETPPESLVMSGGLFHGFQLWVNLPAAKKWSPPAYQDLRASEVVLLASEDGGALIRVIAGELAGHKGPGSTQTPITLIHATLQPGAEHRPLTPQPCGPAAAPSRRNPCGPAAAPSRRNPNASPLCARALECASALRPFPHAPSFAGHPRGKSEPDHLRRLLADAGLGQFGVLLPWREEHGLLCGRPCRLQFSAHVRRSRLNRLDLGLRALGRGIQLHCLHQRIWHLGRHPVWRRRDLDGIHLHHRL
jgi:redox-sensitive bicupin YhaK (pirin superfamily)